MSDDSDWLGVERGAKGGLIAVVRPERYDDLKRHPAYAMFDMVQLDIDWGGYDSSTAFVGSVPVNTLDLYCKLKELGYSVSVVKRSERMNSLFFPRSEHVERAGPAYLQHDPTKNTKRRREKRGPRYARKGFRDGF